MDVSFVEEMESSYSKVQGIKLENKYISKHIKKNYMIALLKIV